MRSEEPAAEARKAEGANWTVLLIPRQPNCSDAYDGIEGTSLPTSMVKATSKFNGQCDFNCICVWHTYTCITCMQRGGTCFKKHLAYQNTQILLMPFSLYILNFQV